MAITIPDKLLERLRLLGLDESVYSIRSCKCMLSREELQLPKVPWYGHAYYTDAKDTMVFDPVSLVIDHGPDLAEFRLGNKGIPFS